MNEMARRICRHLMNEMSRTLCYLNKHTDIGKHGTIRAEELMVGN